MNEPVKPVIVYSDDEQYYRNIVQSLLTEAGYEVRTHAGAKSALRDIEALVVQGRPVIAMTDFNMGLTKMDGVDLMNALSENPALAGVPVIIASSSLKAVEEKLMSAEKRPDAMIAKPLERDSLLGAIHAVWPQPMAQRLGPRNPRNRLPPGSPPQLG